MNEDKLKTLLQQDINLRDAIRQEEAERPQMPADLNARLMQRVSKEKKQKHTRLWPWIAAACVAGIMVVFLTSPKDTIEEKTIVAKVEKKAVEKKKDTRPETPVKEVKKVKPATPIKRQPQQRKPITPAAAPKPLLAQKSAPVEAEIVVEVPIETQAKTEIAQAIKPSSKTETLTERDIPITRPENYKYTPEEIALMKKQANEAYLKWVELELEIAKHSQEQTAQK